jgi:chemotaxis protein methyltransferase CheR
MNVGPLRALRPDAPLDAISTGEFLLSPRDFRRISEMIHADSGIALTEAKTALVHARLAKRLRALRMGAFRDYCDLVEGADGAAERKEMLAALTTNVTRFFREPHHFEHLKSQVLPPLLKHAARGGRVRLWSAACSSGQEPFSIAMTILCLWPGAAGHDVKVLATDIDPHMIAAGRSAVYTESQLEGVSADLRRRFFEPSPADSGGRRRAGEAMRRMVVFRPLNLVDSWPMKGLFNAIFCRNVVIYFDEPTQQRIWEAFLPRLDSDGRLYIGHSERVTGVAAARLGSDGISTYRLAGSARS